MDNVKIASILRKTGLILLSVITPLLTTLYMFNPAPIGIALIIFCILVGIELVNINKSLLMLEMEKEIDSLSDKIEHLNAKT